MSNNFFEVKQMTDEEKFILYDTKFEKRQIIEMLIECSKYLPEVKDYSIVDIKDDRPKFIDYNELYNYVKIFNHQYNGKEWNIDNFMNGICNWLKC
jgi:hypothetical protein